LFSRRSKSKDVGEHGEEKDDALSDEESHDKDTGNVGGSNKIFEKVMKDNDAKNVFFYLCTICKKETKFTYIYYLT
jgi:hypothetical protein